MSKHLTIIRIGIPIASSPFSPLTAGAGFFDKFKDQARAFARSFHEEPAPVDKSFNSSCCVYWLPVERQGQMFSDESNTEPTVDSLDIEQQIDTLVANFARPERVVSLGEVSWICRLSASILLATRDERPISPGTVWISVEGIPDPKSPEPSHEDKIRFFDHVNDDERKNINLAQHCYLESLAALYPDEPHNVLFDQNLIKIALSDDRTKPVANLVDAVLFEKLASAQLRNMPGIEKSLHYLEELATHAAPKGDGYDPASLAVESLAPDINAIVSKRLNYKSYASFTVGLARRVGDGGGYHDVLDELDGEYRPSIDEIRFRSPAFRLSMHLARSQVHRPDQRRSRRAP